MSPQNLSDLKTQGVFLTTFGLFLLGLVIFCGRSNSRGRAATVFHNGRSGVSMPTLYADLQDHTEAQSQTTWERESQTSISGSRTLHFASSEWCVQQIQVRSARPVPGCSDENKDSSRKNGTSGDRPPTTYRRPRHGRSVLMQGLASRKNHRNPRNDNRRAMQSPAWLACHTCHTSRWPRVTARMPIAIGFVARATPVTP
jgi:hypothetical protein